MLDSTMGRQIASLSQKQLFTELINDAYKPKMHKIYSMFLRGAKVDFALNIRKSPFALRKIEEEVSQGSLLNSDSFHCLDSTRVGLHMHSRWQLAKHIKSSHASGKHNLSTQIIDNH